jgi:hypothetical protein
MVEKAVELSVRSTICLEQSVILDSNRSGFLCSHEELSIPFQTTGTIDTTAITIRLRGKSYPAASGQ